jgi:flagellar biosynthesis/type III secretory pathway ATPase
VDLSIDRTDVINKFLKQRAEEPSQLNTTQQQLIELARVQ